MRPRLGITLGDPAGIGPEIIAAALRSPTSAGRADFRLFGDKRRFAPGLPSTETAHAAAAALEEAVESARRREVDALVTGPIHKARMYEIGFEFPGQTEFFAARCGVQNYAMLLTGGRLTVALVTTHLALAEVAAALTTPEIVRVGLLLENFLRRRGHAHPRIAVAGLNPHAGESGSIGREEIEIIAPAVAELQSALLLKRQSGSDPSSVFAGPFSPDTVFYHAANGDWDGILCMYHDQGLIPLKLHAFHEGVNVTLGLPFPRTSPDHGTAFEIAGKGLARPDSMIAAINLALDLVQPGQP